MLECLVRHHRAEVGTADADVDDVADGFAGVALPRAAADAVGKTGHLVEHGVDLGHDVLAIHEDGRASGRAQGHVQHGAVFCEVDFLAAEHGLHALAQVGFPRQLNQQLEGLVGDAVLRIIQEQAGRFRRQAFAALGILGKQFPQMQMPDFLVMDSQCFPSGPLGEWFETGVLGHDIFCWFRCRVRRPF